ncbi:MAG: acetylxylan esterase [Phycisphaeraceae bacterium]
MMRCHFRLFVLSLSLSLLCFTVVSAAGPRAYPEGELPKDVRYAEPKNLDGYFPFKPSETPAQWAVREEFVHRQIRVSQGLWPMPTRTPLNAVVHGKIDCGDYTIEKVYFESYPGHYVTGNLYRPAGASLKNGEKDGKRPGILCPHGHWPNGRFYDDRQLNVKEITNKSERWVSAYRSPLQARCVHLARLGCVVFHYDMIGYADSVQFTQHRPGVRKHMNETEVGKWGYFSPMAELYGQNMMGLQTYNSVAATDFILSLPEVDAQRVACTGASGGGTQTMILTAIEGRIKVSFPAVMVSTAMQGGCTCENANYLRLNSGNIEFAAMAAPRPTGISAADDWTKEMMTKGYPELQQHFKMLGVPDHVQCTAYTQFGHNYNYMSRQVMYRWFNKHLNLNVGGADQERDFDFKSERELSVWDESHPKPSGNNIGDTYERGLLKWMTQDRQKQLADLEPKKPVDLLSYRYLVGGGWDVLIGRQPRLKQIEWELTKKKADAKVIEMAGILRDREKGEEVPAVFLYPKEWNKQVVIWIDGKAGKSGIYQGDGTPIPEVQSILDKGASVCAIDLFKTGEYLKAGEEPATSQKLIGYSKGDQPWQQFVGYTYGYNHSMFARRVHDVMTAIALVHSHERTPDAVDLVGVNGGGVIALAARAQVGALVRRCAVDTEGFRFVKVTEPDDAMFVPGAVGLGDVPALIALSAPGELWITGEAKLENAATKAYDLSGKKDAVTLWKGDAAKLVPAAAAWLLR